MKSTKFICSLFLASCLGLCAANVPDSFKAAVSENAFVMKNYNAFSQILDKAKFSKEDQARILDAVQFAATKHALQTRENAEKTPYISHPIGVATYLITIGNEKDPNVVIGALLHDTLDGTNTTPEEISKAFGAKVAEYVQELTVDPSLTGTDRQRAQISEAAKKSPGAAAIKLADLYYNLTDLKNNPPPSWSEQKKDTYYLWAAKVAHTLPDVNPPLKQAIDKLVSEHFTK